MAITGTLTTSSATTDSGVVSYDKSIVHISGTFVGIIVLEAAPTGTTNWVNIVSFDRPYSIPINTPDATMLYRFNSNLVSGEAEVYVGV